MTETIKKRIMAIANSPNPKDYDTLAKTINTKLGYPLLIPKNTSKVNLISLPAYLKERFNNDNPISRHPKRQHG